VIIDAVDARGRRYLEVDAFPDGPLKEAFRNLTSPDPCVECGREVKHAFERYFQRNDATDGTEADNFHAAMSALTYDCVCGACGDKLLQEDAI
jgi:DNA-directed RNA polymerase subunit N (RpoN/RPB10)